MRAALVILASVACAAPLAAQQDQALAQAVHAFDALDYQRAGALFRQSLAPGAAARLSADDRARARCYLGAIELLDGRSDSAAALFRSLVLEDPGFHPDTVVFPPRVTTFFNQVRLRTPVLSVSVPPESRMGADEQRFAARVATSVPAYVSVVVETAEGEVVRPLFAGGIADTMSVFWDGTAGDRSPVRAGQYELAVITSDRGRGVRVPLEVSRDAVDTLPWPAEPAAAAGGARGSLLRTLATGVVTGAAAAALPAFVAPNTPTTGLRLTVVAVIGVATVAELLHVVPGRGASGDARAAREGWQRSADSVAALNAERRSAVPWTVKAGRPVPLGEVAR